MILLSTSSNIYSMQYWNRKNPDSAILLDYNDDDCSQGYVQVKEVFGALTKVDILQPYLFDNGFRSSNDDDDIGYKLYVFDIRNQKELESAQAIKTKLNFLANIPAGIYSNALVLTNKYVSILSDGPRHFDFF